MSQNTDIYKGIGEQVRKVRMKQKLTQTDLAMACKTYQPVIAMLEAGKSKPTVSFLQKVSKSLGVKMQVVIK